MGGPNQPGRQGRAQGLAPQPLGRQAGARKDARIYHNCTQSWGAWIGLEQNRLLRLVFGKPLEQEKGERYQQGQDKQGGQLELPIDFIDVLFGGQFATFFGLVVII